MIARFINRHFVLISSLVLALAVIAVLLLLSGCYLENRESMRPVYSGDHVMQDLQDQADTHPLEGWSR